MIRTFAAAATLQVIAVVAILASPAAAVVAVTSANLTDFACDFEPGEDCLWTWEQDNFTESSITVFVWPGQHGFHRLSGLNVAKFHNKAASMAGTQQGRSSSKGTTTFSATSSSFYGPSGDRNDNASGKSTHAYHVGVAQWSACIPEKLTFWHFHILRFVCECVCCTLLLPPPSHLIAFRSLPSSVYVCVYSLSLSPCSLSLHVLLMSP